jgi:hypothetical protein
MMMLRQPCDLPLFPRWYLEARKLSEQYGPVVGLRFFSITLLIVTDPELAKVVLMGSADAFPKSRA